MSGGSRGLRSEAKNGFPTAGSNGIVRSRKIAQPGIASSSEAPRLGRIGGRPGTLARERLGFAEPEGAPCEVAPFGTPWLRCLRWAGGVGYEAGPATPGNGACGAKPWRIGWSLECQAEAQTLGPPQTGVILGQPENILPYYHRITRQTLQHLQFLLQIFVSNGLYLCSKIFLKLPKQLPIRMIHEQRHRSSFPFA
ncbi:MAG: hypothetical protein M2R45_02825 [Verrucomicrobia subdivision 3 bacterium]|nr:hypothetical protein [Limisphaerales bacterium]MCS1415472.1 hypothetical protein [Limisphaerales bacterium]